MAIDKIFKKSVAFLDPRNHQLQNILQRVVQNSTKNIECLRINLMKMCKTLIKKIIQFSLKLLEENRVDILITLNIDDILTTLAIVKAFLNEILKKKTHKEKV